MEKGAFKLQVAVFALVSASFANIYITQPVLPVLQQEFRVTPVQVSLTVSAVIFGIVLSSLFFGSLSDKISIHPILLTGGICVAAGGVISALTQDFKILVAARFFQGLFLPAMTTSLSAWLARTLPGPRLNVVMGSYVSATVLGGLSGRLLGGFIHPPLHWRYAFFSAAGLIVMATIAALLALPRSKSRHAASPDAKSGLLPLLKRKDLVLIYGCGAGSLLIFSPVFNFLPYRMEAAPFHFSTELITMIYLVYVLGIFLGPMAGKLSNRFGGGHTLIAATIIEAVALLLLLIPSVTAVIMGLLGVCAGFFTIHAVAVGLLNRKLSRHHGKANAIYMLFYYTGGWFGITGAGFAFERFGWQGVVFFVMCFLAIPLFTGLMENKTTRVR
jgi:YNFM family putative membrane transporter